MVASHLQVQGLEAMAYHAGKIPAERLRIQDLFTRNKLQVLAATVAFGMGVDKPDIRNIIHFTIPRSIEHYVQVSLKNQYNTFIFTVLFRKSEELGVIGWRRMLTSC